MINIGITTGDKDGIGLEVTQKAVETFSNINDIHFFIWKDKGQNLKSQKNITEVDCPPNEVAWFIESIEWAKNNKIDAIVTGPLSKKTIKSSGLGKMGHTEILKNEFKEHKIFMAFSGEFFNTLLLTTHVPIGKVEALLTKDRIVNGIYAAKKWAQDNNDNRPIAFVGLNPHAGENGLIGTKDLEIAQICKDNDIGAPLVPDVAFLKKYWDKYSLYICPYHDQALIPFKMAHNHQNACQISWGLPIIRTSVDHGTAKDIAGQNIASADSMIYAINKAIQLAKANN